MHACIYNLFVYIYIYIYIYICIYIYIYFVSPRVCILTLICTHNISGDVESLGSWSKILKLHFYRMDWEQIPWLWEIGAGTFVVWTNIMASKSCGSGVCIVYIYIYICINLFCVVLFMVRDLSHQIRLEILCKSLFTYCPELQGDPIQGKCDFHKICQCLDPYVALWAHAGPTFSLVGRRPPGQSHEQKVLACVFWKHRGHIL